MNYQDLANIKPALLIAIETHGTIIQDKEIWIEIYKKIDRILATPPLPPLPPDSGG